MTGAQVSTAVTEVQAVGDLILHEVETVDPAVAVPAGVAEMLLDMAAKAVAAWTNAAGIDPTVATFLALEAKLNPAPLTPPTA